MTVLPNLERLLGDAADRLGASPSSEVVSPCSRPSSRRPQRRFGGLAARSLRVSVMIGVGAAVFAAAAVAGVGLLTMGTSIGPQPDHSPASSIGWGSPVRDSMEVLALRVPDPAGGPPWGLGVFETTRGVACPVTGRVSHGQIGALGIDYAFKNDGRFHPLLPSSSIGVDCEPPDANSHLFLTGSPPLTTSSGDTAQSAAISQRPHCNLPGEHDWAVRCPQDSLRVLYYGFLGPAARSVGYTFGGVRVEERVSGPSGGYLVVLPAPPGSTVGKAGALGDVAATPTLYATYTNGRTCAIQSVLSSRPGSCALVGYVQAPTDLPSQALIASHARATYHGDAGIVVTFKARVAVTNTQSAYGVHVVQPSTPPCTNEPGLAPLDTNTDATIAAGATLSLTVRLASACRGRYVGRVYFYRDTSPYEPLARLLDPNAHPPGVTVAVFTVVVP